MYEMGDTSLRLSGDLRFRIEEDWDSRTGDGGERDDRTRVRTRMRVRLDAQIDESWSATFRVRSGSDDSQQGPHITIYDFEGNDTGDADFNFDLWYGRYKNSGFEIAAGRKQINLWRQDDNVFTHDVTVLGLGASYTHGLGEGELSWNADLGSLPAGMRGYSGQYASGQVVYAREKQTFGVTLAGAYLGIDANPDDEDGLLLLTENNIRDYETVFMQAQVRLKSFSRPLKFGTTFGRNLKDYDDEPVDSFSEFHKDDVDFFNIYGEWGSASKRGELLLGYYYSYFEALGVSSSYKENDWVRWGNANQTRSTNMKGSEFRLAYGLADYMDLVARLYLVDAIDFLNADDVAKEDGKRARIDLNIRF